MRKPKHTNQAAKTRKNKGVVSSCRSCAIEECLSAVANANEGYIVKLLAWFLMFSALCCPVAMAGEAIPLDPKFSEHIKAILTIEAEKTPRTQKNEQWQEVIEEMVRSTPRPMLIQQIGLLSGVANRTPEYGAGELLPKILLQLLKATPEEMLLNLIPLWSAGDAPLRKGIREILDGLDIIPGKIGFFDADFSRHLAVLANPAPKASGFEDAMIDYLFSRSPGRALLELSRRDGATEAQLEALRKGVEPVQLPYNYDFMPESVPVPAAEAARETLLRMVQTGDRWQVLFAAELYAFAPAVRSPQLETALRAQPSPLIARRLEAAAKKPM